MTKLAHYIIGFSGSKGEPKIHDGWFPEQDINTKEGLSQIKAHLLSDFFSLDSVEQAEDLDAFHEARVIKAQASPQAHVIDQSAGSAMGHSESVVLRKTIQRWDVNGVEEKALPNEPQYNVVIKDAGSQIYIDVMPAGVRTDDVDAIENFPQMSISLEINNGLPCIHLYGDIYGDLAQTIFAEPNGKLGVRPGDADHDVEKRPKNYQPNTQAMIDFIEQAKRNSENERVAKGEKIRESN